MDVFDSALNEAASPIDEADVLLDEVGGKRLVQVRYLAI